MAVFSKCVGAVFIALLACPAAGQAPRPGPRRPSNRQSRRQDEPSVHPGINDPYFLTDGPAQYTRILEAENREIVQSRRDIVGATGLRRGMAVAGMKREEGKSGPGVLRHVRAGTAAVIEEVEQSGFVLMSETDLLEENYCLHFRRP